MGVIWATVVGASVTVVVDGLVVGDVGASVVGDVGEVISEGEELTVAEEGSVGEVAVVCEVDTSVVEELEDPSVCEVGEAVVSVTETDVGVVEL